MGLNTCQPFLCLTIFCDYVIIQKEMALTKSGKVIFFQRETAVGASCRGKPQPVASEPTGRKGRPE